MPRTAERGPAAVAMTEEDLAASAAVAASAASVDAAAAARAATRTKVAAFGAAEDATLVAIRVKAATATAVAAAASATAEVAVRAAAAVQSEAAARALDTASSAVAALETVAAELPAASDQATTVRRAAAVAATVAADVRAYADATASAAATVSTAVRTAAETAATAAEAAALAAETEAVAAALIRAEVAVSTATTAAATGLVVESASRATELATRLRVLDVLRDSERRFRVTFEHAPVGMMLVSLTGADPGGVLRVNPALRQLSGRTEADLLALNIRELVHAGDQDEQLELFSHLRSGGRSAYQAVLRWRHADGRDVWVRMSLHEVREGDAPAAYAVGQVEDITERRRADAVLRTREERFRLAFDNALTGMMFLSTDGRLRKTNGALTLLLGHGEQDLLGRELIGLACEQDRASIGAAMSDLISGQTSIYQAEHCFRHADGSLVWGLLSGSLTQDQAGQPDYLVFQIKDVTARRDAELRLAHQAMHDDLTGLPNRLLLRDRLEQACARAERAGTHVAVLFVDLDDFKDVNDTLGHLAGDRVLVEVAARLRSSMRGGDTVARLGGDEFVVVCDGLSEPAAAGAVADRITHALAGPMSAGDSEVEVTASIGITVVGGTGLREDVLRRADTAMYQAKANGKDRYEVYDPVMRVAVLNRLTVAAELSHALAREELRLHYQPTYDLRTGGIVGVEALLRWQHPTRGLLAPGEFLEVAEARRMMIPIGDWVLATAGAQASAWQRAFGSGAPDMWVNISSQQLGGRHLIGVVEQTLADTGLAPTKLGLEVTERQLLGRAEAVHDDLIALRGLGLRLAVDDFGTGFASLDYLRRFPFDAIKIDQAFVGGLGIDRTDTAVTTSIIALGQSLDLVVVAEGVETQDQYHRLQDLGCDLAQGYLMQRPAPPETIDVLLADRPALRSPVNRFARTGQRAGVSVTGER